ncbi:MAG TPA: two-component regulator propeller domain-containing protein [Flavobacteriaceae bacterium]|nr:two-component regulator propeller domain-containing protein [Flavobacteriaceae bacterium]
MFPSFVFAQDFSANWEDLFSYYQIQDIAYANGKIYAAAQNAVFTYQIGSGATEKISSINGLSGKDISEIHYSSENDALLVGYKNGLMEIVREGEAVLSVIDILEKQTISPDKKTINHFYEFENKVYISTGYGISVYDLENWEFGETFFIGNNGEELKVSQTTIFGDYIYAATSQGGIRRANVNNPNLIDFSNWQAVEIGNWSGVVTFQNTVYATKDDHFLYKLQGNSFVLVRQFNQIIRDLRASDEVLTLTTTKRVRVYNEQFTEVITIDNLMNETLELSSAQYFANRVFLGDTRLGLLKVSASATSQFEAVSPDGPLMNKVFDMTAIPNELWVVYGEYSKFFDPNPATRRGLSHLIGEEWDIIPYEKIEEFGGATDLADIAVNPNNTDQVFVSSYHSGLLEFENGELIKIYDETNSSLDEIVGSSPGDIRIGGIAFDDRGNLYLTNGLVENPLKRLTPGGEIQNIDVSEAFVDPLNSHVTELILDNAGNVYFGTHKYGIIAYQPSTNKAKTIDSNTPGADFPDSYNPNPVISAMTLDENNRLWIGTDKGLRVMYGPAGIFQGEPNVSVQPIIFLEGDVAQELFFEQYVTDIAVDGANNKWVSTGDSGIFYLSENGQETIYHFTTENSPLPSNGVNSVEIDPVSGKVYIGTINGLVAFQGSVVQGEETLANVYVYPNPVRPGYNGLVTIAKLTENANVKITDITGNLVYETVSEGGSVQWDTRAFGKHKVASGVYLVLITGEKALETKVTKIMIVR